MTTLYYEQLYGCLDDGSKGHLLQDDHDVGAQLVAGRGMFEENDPFSACLMEMDLSSSMTEDLMVEEYARVPSPSTSSFITTNNSTIQQEGMNEWNGLTHTQMDAWTHIPAYFQLQLCTHYALYLKEIQQVLDLQLQMDSPLPESPSLSSSVTSSPSQSTPTSPVPAQVPVCFSKKLGLFPNSFFFCFALRNLVLIL